MRILAIDIETYSSIDLVKVGAYRYASSPDYEILLFAYSFDDEEISIIDVAKGEKIPDEILNKLNEYIKSLSGPFDEKVVFKILDSKEHINGAKLGTYGIIKGATKFIAAKIKEGEFALEELGYEMESLVLYATALGLGTCWIGGTFKKGQFAKAMEVESGEILPIISPIGYESENKSFVEKTMRRFSNCDYRKPWNKIFFFSNFICTSTY